MKRKKATPKGKRMARGKGYKITATKGKSRYFRGTLLSTHMVNGRRIALFSVPVDF